MASKTKAGLEAAAGIARRMTLFDLAAGWQPLLEARIDAETSPDLSDERPVCEECAVRGGVLSTCEACHGSGLLPSERECAIEAAEVALVAHAQAEVEKVDDYIGVLGYVEAAIAFRKAEAKRQQAAVRVFESMLEQIKATAVVGITAVEGRKKIEGERGALVVKANGGVAPLMVDMELLPDEFVRFEGWVNAADWEAMIDATCRRMFTPDWTPRAYLPGKTHDGPAIRAALAEPCPDCIAGVVVQSAGEGEVTQMACPTCGGSGKNAVPGARLGERGAHLEVR